METAQTIGNINTFPLGQLENPPSGINENIGNTNTFFDFLNNSRIALLVDFQKSRFSESCIFWKPIKTHYTKWLFLFQIHWGFIYFLNGIQKTFVFKNISFFGNQSKPLEIQILSCSKTIGNSYTFWLISGKCSF